MERKSRKPKRERRCANEAAENRRPLPVLRDAHKVSNPEMLRLLTDIRDFGFSLRDAERVAALLKKEQEAADGTM